jgi:ABC-type transport system substrate-binding protein
MGIRLRTVPPEAAALLVLASALWIGGCASRPESAARATSSARQAEPTPRRGGTLIVVQERPVTLDPLLSNDVYSTTVANQIFVPLLRFGANLDPTPALARTWTISPDGLTYTFWLHAGVRFHNGRPVTAHDVAYSIERAFAPGVASNVASHYLAAIEGAEESRVGHARHRWGVEVRGDDEIVIRLQRPDPSFLWALCLPQVAVVPREEVEAHGADGFARHPVGCGPFRFVEWTDQRVVLTANPDYFAAPPYLDTLVFITPATLVATAGAHGLLQGRVHLTEVPQNHYREVERAAHVRIIRRRELSLGFLGLNCAIPPLDHPLVRQALACAIDRQAQVELDSLGAVLATGVLPPGVQCYSPVPKALPHDAARARRALAEAGYPEGRGMAPLDFWTPVRVDVRRRADSLLVADLRSVGFRVRVHEVEWRELNRLLDEKRAALFSLSWIADIPDPDSFLGTLFDSRSSSNLFNFTNPQVDSLLHLARDTRDPLERARLFHDVEAEVLGLGAIVPLWHSTLLYGMSDSVHGFQLTPLGISVFDFTHVWLNEPRAAL